MSAFPRAHWAAPLRVVAAPAWAQSHAEIPSVLTVPAPSLTAPGNEQARLGAWLSTGNNSVIPASDFQDRAGATTLRDVLEFVHGVFAQPKWGEGSRLSIRGSGVARGFRPRGMRLTQDGIPRRDRQGSMVRLEAGSYGLFRGQFAHGVVSGPFDCAISSTGARQGGFRRNSGGD